jgi:excisionase family DNA binding protein
MTQQAGTAGHIWLSVEDLASRTGLPVQTIYTLRGKRKAPRGTRIGRQVRFHIDDVIAWERDQRQAGA